VRQVFSTGQPVLTDVFVGSLLKRPIVATVVPVKSGGRLAYVAGASEEAQQATTVDGAKVLSFHVRSPITRWHVAIEIPRSAMAAELYRTLAQLTAGVIALAVVSLLLARFLGIRIARSFDALVEPAVALGQGRPQGTLRVHVRVVASVADAIARAGELLAQPGAAAHDHY
jgi:hypothetical protein